MNTNKDNEASTIQNKENEAAKDAVKEELSGGIAKRDSDDVPTPLVLAGKINYIEF